LAGFLSKIEDTLPFWGSKRNSLRLWKRRQQNIT